MAGPVNGFNVTPNAGVGNNPIRPSSVRECRPCTGVELARCNHWRNKRLHSRHETPSLFGPYHGLTFRNPVR